MKNVLLVTSFFPPAIGAGAVRMMKFAKFLPEFGWNPLVLTVPATQPAGDASLDNNACVYRAAFPSPDPLFALGRRLLPRRTIKQPPNVADMTEKEKTFLGRSQFLSSWFLVPDELAMWVPFAVGLGLRIAREHGVEGIVSSSPVQSCHLVAWALSKWLGCAWVADLRDPWVTNPFFLYPTRLHREINTILERIVITHAHYVVTVSEVLRDDLVARYPTLDAGKFQLIPNGFDPDDFVDSLPLSISNRDDSVRIVHSGILFYEGKDPFPFLQAVKSLAGEQGLKDVEIHFAGVPVDKFEPVIQGMGLSRIVKLTNLVPYKKGLEHVLNADILLLISGPGRGVLTTKVFEYLAAFKPILALTPSEGALADLLRQANVAEIVDPDSPQAIADGLRKLIGQARTGYRLAPNREFIQQFSRRNQTRLLVECLDDAAKDCASPRQISVD
jgi:glycosyltransferase involved in cell wall biosynthesis